MVLQATRDLAIGAEAGESVVGIGLAVASLIAMPVLGVAKRRTGQRLDNRGGAGRSWFGGRRRVRSARVEGDDGVGKAGPLQ